MYEKIVAVAATKGISIREIERLCGFAYGTIQRWKRISPSVDKVLRVANALNVTIDEIVKP